MSYLKENKLLIFKIILLNLLYFTTFIVMGAIIYKGIIQSEISLLNTGYLIFLLIFSFLVLWEKEESKNKLDKNLGRA